MTNINTYINTHTYTYRSDRSTYWNSLSIFLSNSLFCRNTSCLLSRIFTFSTARYFSNRFCSSFRKRSASYTYIYTYLRTYIHKVQTVRTDIYGDDYKTRDAYTYLLQICNTYINTYILHTYINYTTQTTYTLLCMYVCMYVCITFSSIARFRTLCISACSNAKYCCRSCSWLSFLDVCM